MKIGILGKVISKKEETLPVIFLFDKIADIDI